jgi:hypothetical protein
MRFTAAAWTSAVSVAPEARYQDFTSDPHEDADADTLGALEAGTVEGADTAG